MSDVTGDVTRDVTRDITRDITVDWAKELGIDLAELATEHPLHPRQIAFRSQWEEKSRAFYATVSERERREIATGLRESWELEEAFRLLATRR
jgi:uncharacterized membrane protein